MENNNSIEKTAICLYCPPTMVDEIEDSRKMSVDYIGSHIAACHIDRSDDREATPVIYECNGRALDPEKSSCSGDESYKTMAVHDFVNHMSKDHPDQEIPFRTRYKASLTNLLKEISIFAAQHQEPSVSMPNPQEYCGQACGYVLYKEKSLPGQNDESAGTTEQGNQSAAQSSEALPKNSKEIAVTEMRSAPAIIKIEEPEAEDAATVHTEESAAATRPILESAGQVADAVATVFENGDDASRDSSITDNYASGYSTPNTSGASDGPSTSSYTWLNGRRRRDTIFNSAKSREMLRKLRERYGKKSREGKYLTGICAKCNAECTYSSTSQSLINHAMSHLPELAFECVLCDYKTHSYGCWYSHFRCRHPEKVAAMRGCTPYNDYYIDHRPDWQEEIAKVTTECFLTQMP